MHLQAERIYSLSSKLTPIATGVTPELHSMKGIKACIFDLYGTLFISGSGDISLANGTDREQSLRMVLKKHGITPTKEFLWDYFQSLIRQSQEAEKAKGTDFPEVDIREIWERFLAGMGVTGCLYSHIESIAIDYECMANPVWAMPSLSETLKYLRNKGMLLGIVSNAQFFTPHLFEAFTGKTEQEHGFSKELCIYSYELRTGKPSPKIYQPLVNNLKAKGIAPEETIFVGNDMRNDIWPAQTCGLKGVLFAGDKRSLRLRKEDTRSESNPPDAVITDLNQLIHLVGENS